MTELSKMQIRHQRLSKAKIIKRATAIFIGAVLMAVGLEIFLVPNNVIDGGITGISIMLSHITGFRLGIFIFLLNLPFFLWVISKLAKHLLFPHCLGLPFYPFLQLCFTMYLPSQKTFY